METVVWFKIEEQTLALPVQFVERVLWAVEITILPGQDSRFLGVINVEGEIIPVLNVRHLLGLPDKDLDLDDHIVTIEKSGRRVAFVVDKVEGVLNYEPAQISTMDKSRVRYTEGLIKVDSGLIVILHMDELLAVANDATSSIPLVLPGVR